MDLRILGRCCFICKRPTLGESMRSIFEKFFSRKKSVAGLDIGSSSLKLVEISDSPDGYVLTNFSQVLLPRGVVVGGLLLQPDILSAKIKELHKKSGTRCRKFVTSLSGHTVIVKKATFQTTEEEELRQLLHDEGEKYLPFDDIKDVNFDFQILGDSDVTPGHMDVMLAAAKKEVVSAYADAIENAGFKPVIMDIDSFALETMYEANYDFDENEIVVLVNIGASITNINVIKQGGSIFTRDFASGGNLITESLQRDMNLDFEEAERIKVERSNGDSDDSDYTRRAESIISEIERSVDYFRSTYTGEYIKKIILSGGSAKIPGIIRALTDRLNIEAEMVNPFRNIHCDPKRFDIISLEDIGPGAALAVGLSLRREDDR